MNRQKQWVVYAEPARTPESSTRPVGVIRYLTRNDLDCMPCEVYQPTTMIGDTAGEVRQQYRERYPYIVRACGNCGHVGRHGADGAGECTRCECPGFDFGMTDEEKRLGRCRWGRHKAHSGSCQSCSRMGLDGLTVIRHGG